MCDKKKKSTALLFSSLIMGICEAFGVKFEESDEKVKNEGAIIVRTVERIAGESTTVVTSECLVTAKPEQTTWIENIL